MVCFYLLSYQSHLPFFLLDHSHHTTILWLESSYKQTSNQPNIRLPLSSQSSITYPFFCSLSLSISCVIHFYSLIHSPLLSYALASNATALLKLLVKSMQLNTILVILSLLAALTTKPRMDHLISKAVSIL